MRNLLKNYGFIICMLVGIIAGCITGAVWPGATVLEPLGTVFINLMFCIVVPMVFCSISSAIANMQSAKRAGKIMGVTVLTFCVTAGIAALIMYVIVRTIPIVGGAYEIVEGEIGETLGVADMIINFFTKPDFMELWSRKAILPLIIFAVLFGFGIQLSGGPETKTAQILEDVTKCIMNTVKIITYYAPIGFFGFFATLVANYGPELIGDYSRTLIIYYVVCFVYMFIFFPIYARFGGGKGAAKVMFKNLFKPAAVSFGTCSSVATIPTNMQAAEETGISKEVSDIVLPLGACLDLPLFHTMSIFHQTEPDAFEAALRPRLAFLRMEYILLREAAHLRQHGAKFSGDRYIAVGGIGFQIAVTGRRTTEIDVTLDMHQILVEIEVAPLQAQRLAAPQAEIVKHCQKQAMLVVLDGMQYVLGFLIGQSATFGLFLRLRADQ